MKFYALKKDGKYYHGDGTWGDLINDMYLYNTPYFYHEEDGEIVEIERKIILREVSQQPHNQQINSDRAELQLVPTVEHR